MSRDPEEGSPTDPASLHKYLYAGGDPVNMVDRTGHEASEETAGVLGHISLGTAAVHVVGTLAVAIECAYVSNATKSQAEVEAGITQGTVRMVAPCVWKAIDCEKQYEDDQDICRGLPSPGARSRCWESALNRFNRCKQGWNPPPPLITW